MKGSIGWSESTLNRGVLANRGYSQSLVGKITLPGSDLSFFKIDYHGQVFAPLNGKDYALRFHTRLGYAEAYGSTSELPFYEHYYAGGFNSVRGFEESSLGPRSTPSVVRTKRDRLGCRTIGRYRSGSGPAAIRRQRLGPGWCRAAVPAAVRQGSALPAHRGVLGCGQRVRYLLLLPGSHELQQHRLGDMASSVGVGLTWLTALGPLSFSLGMPIKEPENSDTQVFQFSLGQTF